MSIASELNNYRNGLDDAYDAVNDMSGIIPQHKNMDNLDQAIRTIPQSAGPTPGDGTLTIQKNGSTVATFTADQSTNTTANITVNDGKAVYMDQDSNSPDHILLYNDFAMTDQITDIYNDVYLKILNGEHIVFIDKANGQGTPLGYPETYMYYGSSSFPDDEAYITLYGVKYDRDTHQFHPDEFSTAILIVYTYQSPDYAVIMPGTEYQGKLTAGSNVTISSGTISATDTTYSDFTGATSSVAGASGLVPAPAAGDESKLLRGDGTWAAQNEPIVVWLNWNSVGTDLEVLGTATGQFMDGYTSATAVGSSFFAGAVSDNKQVIIRTGGGLPVPGRDWATETVRPVQVNYDGLGSATMYFWHETMFVRAQCPNSGTTWTFTKLSV